MHQSSAYLRRSFELIEQDLFLWVVGSDLQLLVLNLHFAVVAVVAVVVASLQDFFHPYPFLKSPSVVLR